MEINRGNYEMYFLDYHEGRLDPGQVAELLVFLEANPDFREEFETYEDILLVPDLSVSFSGKASLKKNNLPDIGAINITNYETWFIAHTEGLLSDKEQNQLGAFLQLHPELKADHELYQKSHVQADLNITFPAKAKLKRSVLNLRRFYYYSLATAASLALLLSIYLNTGVRHEPGLSLVREPKVKSLPNIAQRTQRILHPNESNNRHGNSRQSTSIKDSTARIAKQSVPVAGINTSERLAVAEIQLIPSSGVSSRDLVETKYAFIRQSRINPDIYTNLYDQVKLADHMKNDPVYAPVASSPKNILRSGLKKLGSVFTGKDVPLDRNTINFWTLADLGISGYNLLTDRDLKLLTQSNEKGHVEAYALTGDEFEFERKLKK